MYFIFVIIFTVPNSTEFIFPAISWYWGILKEIIIKGKTCLVWNLLHFILNWGTWIASSLYSFWCFFIIFHFMATSFIFFVVWLTWHFAMLNEMTLNLSLYTFISSIIFLQFIIISSGLMQLLVLWFGWESFGLRELFWVLLNAFPVPMCLRDSYLQCGFLFVS